MADVLDKPNRKFYDIDKETYNRSLLNEFKRFKKQLDNEIEVDVEQQQTITTVFDTRLR